MIGQRHHERSASPRHRSAMLAAVVAAVFVVVSASGESPVPASELARRQAGSDVTLPTSTTIGSDGSSGAPTRATPTGTVAFITPTGEVLVGQGAAAPTSLGFGAAVGPSKVGAVALSPEADAVAWVSAQGSVVVRDLAGGAARVVANDAVVSAVGRAPVLAWSADGLQLAYVAVGTRDMIQPRRTNAPASGPDVFPSPLPPTDTLGNVVKVVTRNGVLAKRVGDPSQRSVIGITWSASTQLMAVQSVIPGTTRRYTIAVVTPGNYLESPTQFSVDDPEFSPDGRFLVGVGPSKGRQELIKVSTETFDRSTLAVSSRICSPAVSPDASRVVFGRGPRCRRVGLVAASGGRVVNATPAGLPVDVTFRPGSFGWTAEGRYFTHAVCRRASGCGGPSFFYDFDTRRKVAGPAASTVATPPRSLASSQRVGVDVEVSGPLRFSGSFPLDAGSLPKLSDTTAEDGLLSANLVNGSRRASITLQGREGSTFVTGQLSVADPASGVDRTLMVMGRLRLSGVQAFGVSGIWISTDDFPFASGKFTWVVRRR